MIWLAVLVVLLVLTLAIFLPKLYQNPRKKHQKTPGDFNIPFEEVRFPTQNSRSLYGWWIRASQDAAAAPTLLLVHGWGRNVERTLPYIRNLYPAGFNLLAFDSRNHGSSDSDRFSSMIKFAEDISAALDFVLKKGVSPEKIGTLGLSIGGAASIYAAAHDPRIKAVVTVGAFAHPGDVMRSEFRRYHIPYFPLVWLLFEYFQWRIGGRFDTIAPENQIARSQAKFLLIHGERDKIVPVEHARRLKKAAGPNSVDLWIVPDKGHSDCHFHPDFWPRVSEFFKNNL